MFTRQCRLRPSFALFGRNCSLSYHHPTWIQWKTCTQIPLQIWIRRMSRLDSGRVLEVNSNASRLRTLTMPSWRLSAKRRNLHRCKECRSTYITGHCIERWLGVRTMVTICTMRHTATASHLFRSHRRSCQARSMRISPASLPQEIRTLCRVGMPPDRSGSPIRRRS